VELLRLVPTTATTDRDAAVMMECIELKALAAEATWWQL
jgi:hypothetical protein